MPGDILELITLDKGNKIRPSLRTAAWKTAQKASFLRLRGIYYHPEQLVRLYHETEREKHFETLTSPLDWIVTSGTHFENFVPSDHVAARCLWDDFARNKWNRTIRGKIVL